MAERGLVPCIKQQTRCVVERGGERVAATNLCRVEGLTECPRVTAGCPTGEGYELCGSTHAEANAAALLEPAEDELDFGTAYLYGHDWLCGPCQWALSEKNVTKFVLMTPRKPGA